MSGIRRISDHERFWPFVYLGLKGEAVVSKRERVAFSGTPPQSVIGHSIGDWALECALVVAIQDAKTKVLRASILGELGD